jgi:hypothetical protein
VTRRTVLRLSACLTFLAGPALQSCTAHPRPDHPAKPPQPTGSLAGRECAGDTPAALRPTVGEIADPDAEAIAAWLAKLSEDGEESARLRAYLRCLAERGAEGEPAAGPPLTRAPG